MKSDDKDDAVNNTDKLISSDDSRQNYLSLTFRCLYYPTRYLFLVFALVIWITSLLLII